MWAKRVGVVGFGSSADITLLQVLVQPLVLWLALVRLVMAMAGCRRYPFIAPLVSVFHGIRHIRQTQVSHPRSHK
jgi:hypothetical protein